MVQPLWGLRLHTWHMGVPTQQPPRSAAQTAHKMALEKLPTSCAHHPWEVRGSHVDREQGSCQRLQDVVGNRPQAATPHSDSSPREQTWTKRPTPASWMTLSLWQRPRMKTQGDGTEDRPCQQLTPFTVGGRRAEPALKALRGDWSATACRLSSATFCVLLYRAAARTSCTHRRAGRVCGRPSPPGAPVWLSVPLPAAPGRWRVGAPPGSSLPSTSASAPPRLWAPGTPCCSWPAAGARSLLAELKRPPDSGQEAPPRALQ